MKNKQTSQQTNLDSGHGDGMEVMVGGADTFLHLQLNTLSPCCSFIWNPYINTSNSTFFEGAQWAGLALSHGEKCRILELLESCMLPLVFKINHKIIKGLIIIKLSVLTCEDIHNYSNI